ncbi:MAG: hypothetical protein WD139_02570 [Balneolaceae bacterium]
MNMEKRSDNITKDIHHVKVYHEDGKFAGWPATNGTWCWWDEILVGFVQAYYMEPGGHTYDQPKTQYKYGSRAHLKLNNDDGKSWSHEITLRAYDDATNDIGFPRKVQRNDGKSVIVYYWNYAVDEPEMPYRNIAATIVNPNQWE